MDGCSVLDPRAAVALHRPCIRRDEDRTNQSDYFLRRRSSEHKRCRLLLSRTYRVVSYVGRPEKEHGAFFFSSMRVPLYFLTRVQICEQSVTKCKKRIISALTARMYTRAEYLDSDRASLLRTVPPS